MSKSSDPGRQGWGWGRTDLVDEKRGHKLPRLEDLHHLPDQLVVGRLRQVGFKAHVGELGLWGDVNGPVRSLRTEGPCHPAASKRRPPTDRGRHSRQSSFRSWSIHKG